MKLEPTQTQWKWLRYLFFSYAVISLLFISNHLYTGYSSPTHNGAIRPRADGDLQTNLSLKKQNDLPVDNKPVSNEENNVVQWSTIRDESLPVSQSLVLSKIFNSAMGPSNVTSYFYKARNRMDPEDITMATLVTRDRFPVLSRLATHYKGPISAAIHVNDDESKDETLTALQEMYESNADVQKYVDIHLILDTYDRQFNMWRNVAKLFARTNYIMMLDVDFHLCTDLQKSIRGNADIMARLRQGRTAFVVPAFEYILQADGVDAATFPKTKSELLQQVGDGKIDMFHKGWLKGHGSTDYSRWYNATDLYQVDEYDFSYEPYIIYKKEDSPWCDERFIGYGANKAACLYEIYLSGIDYVVVPNDFLIHQTHDYPEKTRRKERQYNRTLYSHFREEICIRYARMFLASSQWDTPRAQNLRRECQKIRNFRSTLRSTS